MEEKTTDETDIPVTIQILEDTLSIIQYGEKKIFLIGTHHMSATSAQQVHEVIEEVHPETIVLEICPERAEHIFREIKSYKNRLKDGKKMSKYEQKQLLIGGEFRSAIEEAQKIDAKLVYGDMDQTMLVEKFKFALKKSLQNPDLSFNDRMKLRLGVITWSQWFGMRWNPEKTIDQMRDREVTKERNKFMSEKAPYLQNGVIEERNDIIALSLRNCKGNLVVGVVGMDHMEGIEKRFETKFVNVDLDIYEKAKKEMMAATAMERLSKLNTRNTWIGSEFKLKHNYSSQKESSL